MNIERSKLRGRYNLKRKNLEGRCRLSVYKSDENIYAQIIDDKKGVTLAQASTLDKEYKSIAKEKGIKSYNISGAELVGELVGKRGKEKGIEEVVFDRSGYKYNGRIKALAESAKKGGLKF